MSGGVFEAMAAYRRNTYGSSGFTESTLTKYNYKYYDEYNSESILTTFSQRILGDATGEMGPFYYYADKDGTNRQHNNWYADRSGFVYSSNPWFHRGGLYSYGVTSGQFNFHNYNGGANGYLSFRLVLA